MTQYKSNLQKTWLKGLNASINRYDQPPGTVPRISNLLFTKRGALITCDGTQMVNEFNFSPTGGRGKDMCSQVFAPIGVARYYLRIMKALDQHLGAPANLSVVDGGAAGNLPFTPLFYAVTAIDGAGGETLPSQIVEFNPISAGRVGFLTWNYVPNAVGYNIYRGQSAITLKQLAGAGFPIPQVAVGTPTVTFADTGNDLVAGGIPVISIQNTIDGYLVQCSIPHKLTAGQSFVISGNSNPNNNVPGVINYISSPTSFVAFAGTSSTGPGTGGDVAAGGANLPTADTTQQTALYKMPAAADGPSYTNQSIVAFFTADIRPSPEPGGPGLDGGIGGGSGGGGKSGGGGSPSSPPGPQGSTPSGGIPGSVSFIPQMVQFANQMAIALGNGFPPQVYKDATGTPTNPAATVLINQLQADNNGVVLITTVNPHGVQPSQIGACIVLKGIPNVNYNQNPNGASAFVVTSVPSATTLTVTNPNAAGQPLIGGQGGTLTVTTTPFISTFTTAYPVWAANVTYLQGDIVIPNPANGHFYTATQGGISAAAQPAFPTGMGAEIPESSPSKVVWKESGLTNTTSPPPPGAGHMIVFAGTLWVWNTSPSDTTNGLDGPTSLRMSDINNLSSWNPINQAFLDKDDGTEGMGIASFTIAGFGIPPEGSMVAFKNYSGYQIVGVFGSPNFLIQRIKSDLGCLAPRTIQFATGYGLMRFTHLGHALFDGINDRVLDEELHPYVFPANEIDTSDIITVDYSWMPVSWGTQTAYPPMYISAMPIGASQGRLSRLFCYDLVLKAWAVVDLPFFIGQMFQARAVTSVPITLMGSFDDGQLLRWQAGDDQWAATVDTFTGGTFQPTPVNWSVETPMVYNQQSQGGRVYFRQLVIKGKLTDASAVINVSLKLQGEPAAAVLAPEYNLGTDGTFAIYVPINEEVTNANAIISGTGAVELESFDWQTLPKVATVPPRLT